MKLAIYNFNGVSLPNDTAVTSGGQGGIRFGTNVITARGYKQDDCREIVRFSNEMAKIAKSANKTDAAVWPIAFAVKDLAMEVAKFAEKFPLPGVTSNHIF